MKMVLSLVGLCGAVGVTLGAAGAHGGVHDALVARGSAATWSTAVLYHLIHTIAALALGRGLREGVKPGNAWWAAACVLWFAGIVLFSGSLYGLSLGGPKWLGPVTPLGGIALIAGWACVMVGALRPGGPAGGDGGGSV